jgi:hypothetical protein
VARTAGLLAVAALPGLAGIGPGDFVDPVAFTAGFQRAMHITGLLAAASGLIAFIFLTGRIPAPTEDAPLCRSCPLDAPGIRAPEPAL